MSPDYHRYPNATIGSIPHESSYQSTMRSYRANYAEDNFQGEKENPKKNTHEIVDRF